MIVQVQSRMPLPVINDTFSLTTERPVSIAGGLQQMIRRLHRCVV